MITRSNVLCLVTCNSLLGTMRSTFYFDPPSLRIGFLTMSPNHQIEQAPRQRRHLTGWCRPTHRPSPPSIKDQEEFPGRVDFLSYGSCTLLPYCIAITFLRLYIGFSVAENSFEHPRKRESRVSISRADSALVGFPQISDVDHRWTSHSRGWTHTIVNVYRHVFCRALLGSKVAVHTMRHNAGGP